MMDVVEDEGISIELIEKFDKPVPRYTSYPTVPHWKNTYTPQEHVEMLEMASQRDEPLSFYIHLPFCRRRCLFCGCNVYITTHEIIRRRYLNALLHELEFVTKILEPRDKLTQFHIGGGTPTHYPPEELNILLSAVEDHFSFVPNAELSIEVHPTVTTMDHALTLLEHGFNRISMGVQDFDPLVQEKIKRNQTFEETDQLVTFFRDHGVLSINFDLIYGLPYQTRDGFQDTMEKVLAIEPDRLAVYSYAHLPSVFRHQSVFSEELIPRGREKLQLFLIARDTLVQHGYKHIGFDHFALPGDELWKAYQNQTLQRNFMGYTTMAGTDLVAIGFSSISDVQGSYAQNSKDLKEYQQMVKTHGVATKKGLKLSKDDLARKDAIMTWLCQFRLDEQELRQKHGEAAEVVIADAEKHFPFYEKLGLIVRTPTGWRGLWLGQLFGRVVAASLDAYLKNGTPDVLFSRAI